MPRRRLIAGAAILAAAAIGATTISAAGTTPREAFARSLGVEAEDFGRGDLIRLKGAVANGDIARATEIYMAQGYYPGIKAYPATDD